MPHDPTPALPIPWEDLERLAADELPPARAAEVRRGVDAHPSWARAFASVQQIQQGLDALPQHEVPLAVLRGVMDAVRAAPAYRPLRAVRWSQLAAGWAAAIVLCFAGWMTVAGAAPAFAQGPSDAGWSSPIATPAWLASEQAPTAATKWAALPALAHDDEDRGAPRAWPWMAGGLVLLVAGVALALRGHAAAARKEATS